MIFTNVSIHATLFAMHCGGPCRGLAISLADGLAMACLVFVAWARVVCLMCAPWGTGAMGPGAGGVHIGWTTSAHVTNTM